METISVPCKLEEKPLVPDAKRPRLIFRLGDKLKAFRLAGGPDLCPYKPVPGAQVFHWESFLREDPSNPTALRIILRRVPGPSSRQNAGSRPSLPQQASQSLPHSAVQRQDRTGRGLKEGPVTLTANKPERPKWVLRIRAFKDPDTLPEKKRRGRRSAAPSDKASGTGGGKRPASEMDGGETSSLPKRSLTVPPSHTEEEKTCL